MKNKEKDWEAVWHGMVAKHGAFWEKVVKVEVQKLVPLAEACGEGHKNRLRQKACSSICINIKGLLYKHESARSPSPCVSDQKNIQAELESVKTPA